MSNPADKLYDFDTQFVRGAASNTDPGSLPVGSYWMTMNMLASGGLLSCRPGYRWVANLPIGKLQGTRIFQPRLGLEQILAAVDGVLYVADWPFADFRPISTIRFSPTASQIFWSGDCDQSAQRTDLEAFDSAIEVLSIPQRMLIMQDGITAPAYWDGGVGAHIRDYPYQTPIGGPMCWVGDRLWVASGDTVYASDIANPLSFREQI
jgi:hypothetical protein